MVTGQRLDQQDSLYGTARVKAVEESRWSPKLALLRRVGEADTVYTNISTGTSPNQVASSSNQSLPSRRAAQAELGWKSQWLGGRLISELALYRLDQTNMISSDLSTSVNFDFTLVGEARSLGLEASFSGQLSAQRQVSASYAYTDAKYRYNAVYGGKRVPNVARQVLNLWGRYAWTPTGKTAANLQLQGRRFAEEVNTTVLPGNARLDLVQSGNTRLADGQALDLQLALRILFDAQYCVFSHLHGARWITPGRRRNLLLTANYRLRAPSRLATLALAPLSLNDCYPPFDDHDDESAVPDPAVGPCQRRGARLQRQPRRANHRSRR